MFVKGDSYSMGSISVLQDNIRFISSILPKLGQRLRDVEGDKNNYRIIDGKRNPVPNLEIYKNNAWEPIHSKYDPVHEADQWAENINGGRPVTSVILFGLGMGYPLVSLVKKHPKISIHIIEPDIQVLYHAMGAINLRELPWRNVESFHVGSGEQTFGSALEAATKNLQKEWEIVYLPSVGRIYGEAMQKLLHQLRIYKREKKVSLETIRKFEKIWIYNIIMNFPHVVNSSSIFKLSNRLFGKPVILTGSGPSLADSIPLIRKVKQSRLAYIIAAGSSVNALLKEEIEPDLVITYDPTKDNFDGDAGLQGILPLGIPLLFGTTVYYELVENHVGQKAYFQLKRDLVTSAFQGADATDAIEDAPTIAAVSIAILKKLMAGPLFLVGIDLAIRGNQFYAEGNKGGIGVNSGNEVEEVLLEHLYFPERSTQGGEARTNDMFVLMRKSIEFHLTNWTHSEVYNLSSFGLHIEGATYLPGEEALIKLKGIGAICKETVLEGADQAGKLQSGEQTKNLISRLRGIPRKIDKIRVFISTISQVNPRVDKLSKLNKMFFELNSEPVISAIVYPMMETSINYFLRDMNKHAAPDPKNQLLFLLRELPALLDQVQQITQDVLSVAEYMAQKNNLTD